MAAASPAPQTLGELSAAGRSSSFASSGQLAFVSTTTFHNPGLLRGSFSTDAMKCWGAVLDRGRATDEWYAMSQPADHLDVFISHNWSMPRLDKFLILALYFNLRAAVLCTVLAVVGLASLETKGVLPDWGALGALVCAVACYAVFVFVLLCWQEFSRLARCRGKLLFLDKACIHQSDAALKQRGIEHLAAFLHYSWNMLVCYSDDYLQKLWTVYEVASFMLLHPGSAIHVSHPIYAKFLIGCIGIVFIQTWLSHALRLDEQFPTQTTKDPTDFWGIPLQLTIQFPISLAMAQLVWNVTRHSVKMSAQIKRFRFSDAACYNEADRSAVKQNIIIFMKHHGHADNELGDDGIIHRFESMVHHDLPKLLAASLGRAGFPYHIAACVVLPYTLCGLGDVGVLFHKGVPMRTLCFRLAFPLILEFAACPLCLAIKFRVAKQLLQKYQTGHACCICILSAIGYIFTGGSYVLLRTSAALAATGTHAEMLGFGMVSACYFMMAFFFFMPFAHNKHYRRLSI